jgi:hypothetical protein
MTPLAADPLPDLSRVAYHDRVSVPDGRIGEVVGFYRRKDESVLVSFAAGTAAEFLLRDVQTLS